MIKAFMFTVILMATVRAHPSPLEKRSSTSEDITVMLEEPCVRQGGYCLRIQDCDAENLVHIRGILCPMQRHLGVECCYAEKR